MTNMFVGSQNYMSPEVFESKMYDFKTDIWSFGCVVFELIKLDKAFNGNGVLVIGIKVRECQLRLPKIEEPRIEFLIKKYAYYSNSLFYCTLCRKPIKFGHLFYI
jgi:serine/threonine protein kinase